MFVAVNSNKTDKKRWEKVHKRRVKRPRLYPFIIILYVERNTHKGEDKNNKNTVKPECLITENYFYKEKRAGFFKRTE